MSIDDKFRFKKLQYDINKQAASFYLFSGSVLILLKEKVL